MKRILILTLAFCLIALNSPAPNMIGVGTMRQFLLTTKPTTTTNVYVTGILADADGLGGIFTVYPASVVSTNTTNVFKFSTASTGRAIRNTEQGSQSNLVVASVIMSGTNLQSTLTSLQDQIGGGVTSVSATVPAFLGVSGVPITTSGTIAITAANGSANTFLAGPASGAPAALATRTLVDDDIPPTLTVSGLTVTNYVRFPPVALAYAGGTNLTLDLNAGSNFYVTLTNTAHVLVSNIPEDGQTVYLHFLQDGTGGRVVTWAGNFKWPGGTTPTVTASPGAVDLFMLTRSPFVSTNLHGVNQSDFR